MERRIAIGISYAFHPIFMPTWGVFAILNLQTYLSYVLSPAARWLIYGTVFLNTALIPIFLSMVLVRTGLVRSMEMDSPEERRFPYLITGFFYLFCYYMLKQYNLPPLVYSMMFGAAVAVILTLLINMGWKISAHAIGITGIAGAVTAVGLKLMVDFRLILALAVLACGLVGFARLKLNAHTPMQVYAGAVLGFVSQFLVVYFEIG